MINREVADMIIINTLGKLNMLPEQSYFLRLVRNSEANSPKVRKAEKFAEKANLVDKIVEMFDFIKDNAHISIEDRNLYNFIKKENVQNLEYFSNEGYHIWFENRLKWLLDTYKGE